MVDEELRPFLLEANTGPVLKEGDMEDMSMVAGLVEGVACNTPNQAIQVKMVHDQSPRGPQRYRGFVHAVRTIAAEDAEAAANAANASIDENGGGGKNGHVRLPPGSTATPQQANIIEQLVNATGANKEALEAAEAAGVDGDGGAASAAVKSKEKEVGVLKDKLRAVIREKHDAVVAARAAEARVAALEAALAAAGVPVPPC